MNLRLVEHRGGSDIPGISYRRTFWDELQPSRAPALEGSTVAEVAIIGGGFAGLSCARYLKEAVPALDLVLLEREHVGFGASGRNAGILSPFLPLTWLIDCLATPQRLDDIRFAVRYVGAEIQALRRLIQQEAIECGFRETSIITTGAGAFSKHQLTLIAERCLLAGISGHVATREEVQAAIPFPTHGGYVLEGYAVQPLALAQGLGRYARRLGVRFHENTRVIRLLPTGRGIEVITANGASLTAGKVIIATNAYTRQLDLSARLSVPDPVHTYMIATAPLDLETLRRVGFTQQTIGEIGREYFYARLHENRLLFGGLDRTSSTAEDVMERDTPCYRRLYAEMIRRFPFLEGAGIAAMWGGAYHESRTRTPVIQPLERIPDVFLNIGYGGVGVTLTQFSGRLLAGLVLGDRHRDPDAERMRSIYSAARIPVMEGVKFAWRLALSLISAR